MGSPVSVFVDVNILRYAKRGTIGLGAPKITYKEDGGFTYYRELEAFDPAKRKKYNDVFRDELAALPRVAELANEGVIDLYCEEPESTLEELNAPMGPSAINDFHGVEVNRVSPFGSDARSSWVIGSGYDSYAMQEEFFLSIQEARFKEIARRVGAYQPNTKRRRNMLADAYYVWTAEQTGCKYFLTMDTKLISSLSSPKSTSLLFVKPIELLALF